jgi:hypothetical protein
VADQNTLFCQLTLDLPSLTPFDTTQDKVSLTGVGLEPVKLVQGVDQLFSLDDQAGDILQQILAIGQRNQGCDLTGYIDIVRLLYLPQMLTEFKWKSAVTPANRPDRPTC